MNYYPYLKRANEVAKEARRSGNTPFGALLVGPDGNILMEQGNAEGDLHDATAHAERVLASRASRKYEKDFLRGCTLVSTCEPCPMCTGAIYWSNIGRIVFGITERQLLDMTGSDDKNPTFSMGASAVLEAGQKDIELIGPVAEAEAEIAETHEGFWDKR